MTGLSLLSCYTTSLGVYLRRFEPEVADRLAPAVRLAVRTDLPDGQVAFSHHHRVDRHDGAELSYAGATRPHDAAIGIRAELAASGTVIVVANTYHLPWSPAYQQSATPHWLLVTDTHDGLWHLVDPFQALLPLGTQEPFDGWLDDAGLLRLMELPDEFPPHLARRDRLALGAAVTLPEATGWRWLRRRPADPGPPAEDAPGDGHWLPATAPSLRWLSEHLSADPTALDDCVEDLWAASRHHTFQADWLKSQKAAPPEDADEAIAAWTDAPRALRFAADSARRGRPRPGIVRTTLDRLADLTDRLSTPLRRTDA